MELMDEDLYILLIKIQEQQINYDKAYAKIEKINIHKHHSEFLALCKV
jgi:hypothetical protein